MKLSFKIASVWGIPIELHLTFILLMAAVFVLFYPEIYFFILTVFLFIFVFFHELAHSVVARRHGIRVRKIILYPIGGVSEIEEIPEKPSIEWRMAVAGPFTSLIFGAVLFGVSQLVQIQVPASLFEPSVVTAGNFLYDLAVVNLLLGAFNLIPAFPMDGGRVFRAFLAERMKFSDATKYAAYIGRLFGIAMVIIGVFFNFWFIIIGVFIYIGASEEAQQTIISTSLARVRVKDVMQSQVGSVHPDQTIAEALEVMFRSRYHDALVEKDQVFLGVVVWDEIIKLQPEQRSILKVGQMPLKKISIFDDESILEAYKLMTREKIDLLPIVSRQDPTKIISVLTSEGIANAFEKAKNR